MFVRRRLAHREKRGMGQLHGEPDQKLQYVRDMLQQLVAIVPDQAGRLLPHLIEMAHMEANERLNHLMSSSDTRPPE